MEKQGPSTGDTCATFNTPGLHGDGGDERWLADEDISQYLNASNETA